MKGIMIQGTASDVGKSLLTTAICRLFANVGWKVAPFKSQNMSNNSYVTIHGEEIGRAQGIQAEAARTEASVWMNPILLKPRSDQQSEIILLGKSLETMSGRGYRDQFYEKGIEVIQSSLAYLEQHYDVLVIEGAGSPVEVNLKSRDLVNMKVAEMADVPVVLVADIDRGGIFASIIGTLELLAPEERERVRGLIINKFRGDISLFNDGIQWLEEKTGVPVLGVIPYIDHHGIDGEDSLSLQKQLPKSQNREIDLVVLHLPYVSNYSDIESFAYEPDVSIRWVGHGDEFGNPDAVIIPGTKSTINDLDYLKAVDLDRQIKDFSHKGGFLMGICGGYQMLGEFIIDEAGSDTGIIGKKVEGLRLISGQTVFHPVKDTKRVKGSIISRANGEDLLVEGYEIHLGKTTHAESEQNFIELENGRTEGFCNEDGTIIGTYLHHLFHNDDWRNEWLNRIRERKGLKIRSPIYAAHLKEERFDSLAERLKENLDWTLLKAIIFEVESNK
ncbi:cobyric acid synthase [Alkalihalobacillus sp. TS-13]|uniref:cobyric acid synthase n=1 Tax=Alkalihalobacillus sp. TS-13 TaxID=2842455 RepID=UPI001C86AA13|nr:cobyric acid synthase [Alkalihalobacillus sp. TS-13]